MVTYVPSLNFKTCFFAPIEEEAVLLSVFYYRIFAFLCRCRNFSPFLSRFSTFLFVLCRCLKAITTPNRAPVLRDLSTYSRGTSKMI